MTLLRSILITCIFGCLLLVNGPLVFAADLQFTPQAPIVQIGKSLTVSVTGTSGEVTWSASKGQILDMGAQVTYLAPKMTGLDIVTVIDAVGNSGVLQIMVTATAEVSLENAQWKIFTNLDNISKLAYEPLRKRLWVATEGGLVERETDTGEIVAIHQQSSNGLPSNDVNDLQLDSQGNLWVATSNGLAKRDPNGSWQIITTKNSNLPSNIVLTVQIDLNNTLWVGTVSGVARYSLSNFLIDSDFDDYQFTLENDLPKKPVYAIVTFPDGLLVMFYDTSLFFRKYGESTWKKSLDGDSTLVVEALAIDKKATGVWVAWWQETSQKRMLFHLNGISGKVDAFFDMNPQFRINALHLDPQNRLWVGMAGSGLGYLMQDANGQWQGFDVEGVPVGEYITALQADNEGNLWVGSGDSDGFQFNGLALLKADGSWETFDTSKLPSNYVRSLAKDNQGNLWIGTQRDIAKRHTNGHWESIDPDPAFWNIITSLAQDSQHGWWIGTASQGLFYRDPAGNVKNINSTNSNLPTTYFVAVGLDKKGDVWVNTTTAGLAHLSAEGQFEIFNTRNSPIPSDYNVYVKDDDSGGLWIATGRWIEQTPSSLLFIRDENGNLIIHDGQGLLHRSAQGEWGTVLNTANSPLPDNNITALLADGKNGVWIGTLKGGLAHYQADGQWEIFNSNNSKLPGNSISSLLSDSNGLWIGIANYYEIDEKGDPIYDTSGKPLMFSHSALVHLDNAGNWLVFNSDNSDLPDNDAVQSLLSDGQGGLWIGMSRGGLAHLTFGKKNCNQLSESECTERQGKHAAILIHPRGQDTGYNQAEAIEFMATYAYNTLYQRYFDHDEVYFLSYKPDLDFNGDYIVDTNLVDAPVNLVDFRKGKPSRDLTLADVQAAFDWAKTKGQLDQPLIVVFVDHGIKDGLLLEPTGKELLTAEIFKGLLDDYQQATGNQVVVILEACQTGTLLPTLSDPPRRLVITSTGADTAYYGDKGRISFLKLYFDQLRRGENYRDSLATARERLHAYSEPFTKQQPQLQGDVAVEACLGGCVGSLPGVLTLNPQVSMDSVDAGHPIDLTVDAYIENNSIQSILASVITPLVASQLNEEEFSRLNMPTVRLWKGDNGKWQGRFSEFTDVGEYIFDFQAKDEDGSDLIINSPLVTIRVNGTNLPTLGTTATGGISVDGGSYQTRVTQNLVDFVSVMGNIAVDSAHVGQTADIVVYAETTLPPNTTVLYFMLDANGNVLLWDKNPAHLAPFQSQVTLATTHNVAMYQGQFVYPGTLKVYFGYRLADGTLVTNSEPIDITII